MTWRESPAWLLELQARFGGMLRTPLDRSTGQLRAVTADYEPELLAVTRPGPAMSADARLATYNRQYWFRLFTLLQGRFSLTARLLGFWRFNQYAADFSSLHPPRGWDIDAVGAGFDQFLARANVEESVLEAARIDAAYHHVFHAPASRPYQFSPAQLERLPFGQLRFSPARALLTEHWPLCELRQQANVTRAEMPFQLEPRLAEARHWLLVRDQLRLGLIRLEPREAELLELLKQAPVGQALAQLEARCSPNELSQLPSQAQVWLARSVRHGAWSGLDFD